MFALITIYCAKHLPYISHFSRLFEEQGYLRNLCIRRNLSFCQTECLLLVLSYCQDVLLPIIAVTIFKYNHIQFNFQFYHFCFFSVYSLLLANSHFGLYIFTICYMGLSLGEGGIAQPHILLSVLEVHDQIYRNKSTKNLDMA